jgi:hypothetical protein
MLVELWLQWVLLAAAVAAATQRAVTKLPAATAAAAVVAVATVVFPTVLPNLAAHQPTRATTVYRMGTVAAATTMSMVTRQACANGSVARHGPQSQEADRGAAHMARSRRSFVGVP